MLNKKAQAGTIAIVLLLIIVMIVVIGIIFVLILRPEIFQYKVKEPVILKTINEDTNKIICNYPYMNIGYSCCLDKDFNKICDIDEKAKEEILDCDYPYIKKGTICCLDDNDNNICDNDEDDRDRDRNRNTDSYLNFPFDIIDVDIDDNKIEIEIENTGTYDYIIEKIDIEDCNITYPEEIIYEDDSEDFLIYCTDDDKNRDIEVEYRKKGSDSTKTVHGRIRE